MVKDLAEPASGASESIPNLSRSGDEFADWVNNIYQGSISDVSRENVQCVMGYIIDLAVILFGMFLQGADRIVMSNLGEGVWSIVIPTGTGKGIMGTGMGTG
ncbi:hypothetical protein BC827DRAFT_1158222 [Russula dissimulans]|nr:hypothetical protein BC827DRAFT_1158222 [Russula dissimulans]